MTKSEYAEYLKSDHWQSVRSWALERAENRCQLCSATGKLDVHHNSYARIGQERPADLIVLCRDCHERHHEKVKPKPPAPPSTDTPPLVGLWIKALVRIEQRSPILCEVVKHSRPTALADDVLTLTWGSADDFHRRKAEAERERLTAAFSHAAGRPLRLEYRTRTEELNRRTA